jgi:virulence-associated protein E
MGAVHFAQIILSFVRKQGSRSAQHATSVTEAPAVYVTLNPVAPALLARANNRLQSWAKYTTTDNDIEKRRWLLFDFDPVRPAGISATDQEHGTALDRAEDCREYLHGQGWPEPVQADSGNGGHLIYRVDLPNDKAIENLLRQVIQAIATRFDDDLVKVDRAVYNASRITKLYGTYAQKGDPTTDRPHRKSAILWNGVTTFEVVTRAHLEAVASAIVPPSMAPSAAKSSSAQNVLGLLTQWGLTVARTEEHQGQSGEVGTMHLLSECPFAPGKDHKDPAIFDFPSSGPVFHCFHASCSSYGWKELRAKFQSPEEAVGDYQCEIITNESGSIKPLLASAIATLENDPVFADVVGYDDFSMVNTVLRPTPWRGNAPRPWSDFDDTMLAAYLQGHGVHINTKTAGEAIQVVAQKNRYHPVQNYLDGLVWDKKPRLSSWLHDYAGCEDTPYVRAVSSCWPISGVARIYRPGCQVDYLPVFLGEQGLLKSSMVRTLAVHDSWFTDSIETLGSKDSRENLRGVWIVEISELSAMRRAEVERVKAFLSGRVDHFRPSYGRRSLDFPRQNIFCGTSNDQTPFADSSGNRRFWPIVCGRIGLDRLRADRDQLWAEAVTRFRAGEPWWLTTELEQAAEDQQREHYLPGPVDQLILEWAADPQQRSEWQGDRQVLVQPFDSGSQRITVQDVLLHGLGKRRDALTRADQLMVVNCLVHNRWLRQKKQTRIPRTNRVVRYYEAPLPGLKKLGEEE